MYAFIQNNTIRQVGALPKLWYDGTRWHDLRDDDGTQAAALGWLPVTETPRPDDTATTTHDRAVELVAGVPTVTWTARPWTASCSARSACSVAGSGDVYVPDALVDRIKPLGREILDH